VLLKAMLVDRFIFMVGLYCRFEIRSRREKTLLAERLCSEPNKAASSPPPCESTSNRISVRMDTSQPPPIYRHIRLQNNIMKESITIQHQFFLPCEKRLSPNSIPSINIPTPTTHITNEKHMDL
jgi:hypothetical protein